MRPHEIAMEYLETPFRHRGRTANGLDCVGLLVMIARRLGMEVEDLKVYGREPSGQILRDYLVRHLGPPAGHLDLHVDDVLLMQLPGQSDFGHVGVVAPHPYGFGIVHAYAMIGRVVYQRIDQRRRSQIREVFRWPDKV